MLDPRDRTSRESHCVDPKPLREATMFKAKKEVTDGIVKLWEEVTFLTLAAKTRHSHISYLDHPTHLFNVRQSGSWRRGFVWAQSTVD
jgi:hypothetical protein